jgi:hypothetical protein
LWNVASSQRYGQGDSIGRPRKVLTCSSSDLQILETSERLIPSIPSARTRSSTLRVDTPLT